MFRQDRLTVEREVYEVIEGEAIYHPPVRVLENFPCHLSVNLNNTVYNNGFPYVISEYTLFLDYDPKVDIKENDTLYVTSSKNEEYKLYAGSIKAYSSSIQIKCRHEKIIESSKE